MRKPEPTEIVKIAALVLAAEATVMLALFLGTVVVIRDHTLWGAIVGWLQ